MATPQQKPTESPDFIPATQAEQDFIPAAAPGPVDESKRLGVDNPNLDDQKAPEPGVLNTLGREIKSFGSGIAGIATAPYRALADPMTPEQQKLYGKDTVFNRMATAPARMIADPIADAAIWYGKAAQGKIPNPVEQALSVAPEGVGQGAGTVVGGKMLDSGIRMARGADPYQEIVGNGLVSKAIPPVVRGAARGVNTVLEKAPGAAGAMMGSVVGRELGHPMIGATAGYALGRDLLPRMQIPGERFGLPPEQPRSMMAAPPISGSIYGPEPMKVAPPPVRGSIYGDMAAEPKASIPPVRWGEIPAEEAAPKAAPIPPMRWPGGRAPKMGTTRSGGGDVTFVPEPRGTFPGEDPNYMASVPRNELGKMAVARKPGAAGQMQQLGKPIIYIPDEADYPGPAKR